MTPQTLVTGATGLLGTQLCHRLVDRDRAITGLRRASSTAGALAELSMAWATADVTDEAAVQQAVAGHDRVYHLAGLGLGDAPPETVREVNREGTRAVVSACQSAGVDRLVFVSTAGTRRAEGWADETDLARPIGAYQRSKRAAEQLVDEAAAAGLDAVAVHPTSVFGPGDRTFTARLLTLATRPSPVFLPGGASFVGIEDVVSGLVAAMERGTAGEHYILGGENHTYREALGLIARHVPGRRPPVEVPEQFVHAAGPFVETVNDWLGTRVFPFSAEMAKLVTDYHFYTSKKAREALAYSPAPLASLVGPAVDWFEREC